MSKSRQIIDLFFRNEYPENTRNKFFTWLIHPVSPTDRDNALQDIWNELRVEADASTRKSYRQVIKKIYPERMAKIRSMYVKIARIAAVFLLPLLSLFFAYLYLRNDQPSVAEMVEYFVPNGQMKEIILPDSSCVMVNSGSILLYPENFAGNKRSVYLNGEAKFTVKHDEKKPFIVKTSDMDVEVLGTVFYVSSYADNEQTMTTLASGKVKIDFYADEHPSAVLAPGEQVIFDRASGQVIRKTVNTDDLVDFEHGNLMFQSASLQQIMKTIERRYDVVIYLNTGNYGNNRLTVKFMYDETLDEVLHTLQYIIKGFNFKIDGKKVYIY